MPGSQRITDTRKYDGNHVYQAEKSELSTVLNAFTSKLAEGARLDSINLCDLTSGDDSLGFFDRDYYNIVRSIVALHDSSSLLARLQAIAEKKLADVDGKEAALSEEDENARKKAMLIEIDKAFLAINRRASTDRTAMDNAVHATLAPAFNDFVRKNPEATAQELINKAIELLKQQGKEYLSKQNVSIATGTEIRGDNAELFKDVLAFCSTPQFFGDLKAGWDRYEGEIESVFTTYDESTRVLQPPSKPNKDDNVIYLQVKKYTPAIELPENTFGREPHGGVISVFLKISKTEEPNEGVVFDEFSQLKIEVLRADRMISDPIHQTIYFQRQLSDLFEQIWKADKTSVANNVAAAHQLLEKFKDFGQYVKREDKLYEYLSFLDDLPEKLPAAHKLSQHMGMSRLNVDTERNRLSRSVPTFQAQTLLLLAYYDKSFAKILFGDYSEQKHYLRHITFLRVIANEFLEQLEKNSDATKFLDYLGDQHLDLVPAINEFQEALLAVHEKKWAVVANALYGRNNSQSIRHFYLAALQTITDSDDARTVLSFAAVRDSIDHETMQHLVSLSGATTELLNRMENPWFFQRLSDNGEKSKSLSEGVQPTERHYELRQDAVLYDKLRGGDFSPTFFQPLLHNDHYLDYVNILIGKFYKVEPEKYDYLLALKADIKKITELQRSGNSDQHDEIIKLLFDDKTRDTILIALHALREDNSAHQDLVNAILNNADAVSVLDLTTIRWFKTIAPDAVSTLFKINRKIKNEYIKWRREEKKYFSHNDRVDHLIENVNLWDTTFRKGSVQRKQLNGKDLYKLLMQKENNDHFDEIFRDEDLRAKLNDLSINKRLKLAWHLGVYHHNTNELYQDLTHKIFVNADGVDKKLSKKHNKLLNDYFHFYFTKLMRFDVRDSAEPVVDELVSILSAGSGSGENRYPKRLPLTNMLLVALCKRNSDEIIQDFVLRCLEHDDVDLIDVLRSVHDSVRDRIIRALFSDSDFALNLRAAAPQFAKDIFDYVIGSMSEAPDFPTLGFSDVELTNVMRLQSQESLIEYFNSEENVYKIADMMQKNNRYFYLLDGIDQDEIIDVFMRTLSTDVERAQFLHFTLSRLHLLNLEDEKAQQEKNIDQQLQDIYEETNLLRQLAYYSEQERDIINAQLAMLDYKRLMLIEEINIDMLQSENADPAEVIKRQRIYNSYAREVSALQEFVTDKSTELDHITLNDPSSLKMISKRNSRINPSLIRRLLQAIIKFIKQVLSFFFKGKQDIAQAGIQSLMTNNARMAVRLGAVGADDALCTPDILSELQGEDQERVKEKLQRNMHLLSSKIKDQLVVSGQCPDETELTPACKKVLDVHMKKEYEHEFCSRVVALAEHEHYGQNFRGHFIGNPELLEKFFDTKALTADDLHGMIAAFSSGFALYKNKIVEAIIHYATVNEHVYQLVITNRDLFSELLSAGNFYRSDSKNLLRSLLVLLDINALAKADIGYEVWKAFLDEQLESDPEFFQNDFNIRLFSQHVFGFDQWLFAQCIQGKLEKLDEKHINNIVAAGTFDADDYIKAIIFQSRRPTKFDYKSQLKHVGLKEYIIKNASTGRLINFIAHEQQLKKEERVLYKTLTSSPVVDAIIQRSNLKDLLKLAETDNKLAEKIAGAFLQNVDLRRTIEGGGLKEDSMKKLWKLLFQNSSQASLMCLLSTRALNYFVNEADHETVVRVIKQSNNDNLIDLLLHEKLRDSIFDTNVSTSAALIELRSVIDTDKGIRSLLGDKTSGLRIARVLPDLIRRHHLTYQFTDETYSSIGPIHEEPEAHRAIFDYMYTRRKNSSNEFNFSDRFLRLLQNASSDELYEIVRSCQGQRKGLNLPDKIASAFASNMCRGAGGNFEVRYPHIIDELLLKCSDDQLFDLLKNEEQNHEYISARIIKLCFSKRSENEPYHERLIRRLGQLFKSSGKKNQIENYLLNVRQEMSTQVAMLFNEDDLIDVLTQLDQDAWISPGGEPVVPWSIADFYGHVLTDYNDRVFKSLISVERLAETAGLLNKHLQFSDDGMVVFKKTGRPLGVSGNMNKASDRFCTYVQNLKKFAVANNKKEFVDFMNQFQIDLNADGDCEVQELISYRENPNKSITAFDQEIFRYVVAAKGIDHFWEDYFSFCNVKKLENELLKPRDVITDRIRRMRIILRAARKGFNEVFVKEHYTVVTAPDKSIELRQGKSKFELEPEQKEDEVWVEKKTQEIKERREFENLARKRETLYSSERGVAGSSKSPERRRYCGLTVTTPRTSSRTQWDMFRGRSGRAGTPRRHSRYRVETPPATPVYNGAGK